ncbi:MAG: ComEC/Rec2 family competence protein [Dehalococcoidia bacterium]|nr:ComEC/Rec2 family competence protein [Dehalococcoidia bacterium]
MILGALAFAWLLGLAAAAFTGSDPWAAVAAASALGALSFALRPRPSTLAFIVLAAALVFAASWRYESTVPPDTPSGIAHLNCPREDDPADRRDECPEVPFRALVVAEPAAAAAPSGYRLAVREVYASGRWRPESGDVLMRAAPLPRFRYGDLLELRGELTTPPSFDDFDYRDYLARRGIGSLVDYPRVQLLAHDKGSAVRSALIHTRARLRGALADALPEPEASLTGGVLLGGGARLPSDLAQDMRVTGTSHLVAVSGQNVSLLAGLLMAALAWAVGRRRAAWLALAAVGAYSLLVGGEPSVVRAAIMGGLYVAAVGFGRQNTAAIALALAAAAMTAAGPQVAHDVGFQLSFSATLGLMTLAPQLATQAERLVRRWPGIDRFPLTRPAVELAAVTLAAVAFTLPITAVNFRAVSLVAPLANVLAVPAFLAVAVTGAITAAAGALVPAAAQPLGLLAWPPAAYMVTVVRMAADIPLASVAVRGVGTGHAIAYYAALAGAVWLLARLPRAAPLVAPPQRPQSARRALLPVSGVAIVLGLAVTLLWLGVTSPVQGRLTVTVLDVGQGEAVLIEGPEGNRILVDAGPSEEAIAAALGRNLPFHDRRVDLALITHPQADHFGGLPAVLERYDVGSVLASSIEADSAAYRSVRNSIREAAVPYREAAPGQTVDLGGGARLYVVSAPARSGDPNDASVVLKLTLGRASFLLTGDIGKTREAALVRSGADLHAVVYKVPHHGSRTSTSPEFLEAVGPLVDVISVGAHNPFGHPSPDVLERLNGDAVFRTDRDGDVSVSTDGRHLWVETGR